MADTIDNTTETGSGVNTGNTESNTTAENAGKTKTESVTAETTTESPTFTQSDVNRLLAEEKRKTEARLKAEAEQKQLESQGEYKQLLEKARNELDQLKQQLAERDLQALRDRIGRKHGLSEELIDRLRGNDESEIEADAKKLKKVLDSSVTTTSQGTPPGGKGSGSKSEEDHTRQLASTGKYSL